MIASRTAGPSRWFALAAIAAVSPWLVSGGRQQPPATELLAGQASTLPRGPDEQALQQQQKFSDRPSAAAAAAAGTAAPADREVAVMDDTSAAEADKGHSGHSGHSKPIKTKKKKPMGKHKKKKQSFKDKLLPLLLIPFVIQTMLIPMFIMNLKMLAMKAMTVGKFAILLILFNMFRSWQQNANSTSIRGTMDSLMAQNYGYNGGPEYGALWNGR